MGVDGATGVRPPPVGALVVLVAAQMAAAAFTVWWRGSHVHTTSLVMALTLLGSWSYSISGAITWRSRPRSQLGPIMSLTGLAVLIVQYQHPPEGLRLDLALWFAGLPIVLLAWLMLAYPKSHLATWPRRLVVGAGAILVLPLGFLFTGAHARDAALAGQLLTFVVAGMASYRFLKTRPGPARRALAPVPFAALVLATEGARVTGFLLGWHTPTSQDIMGWLSIGLHPLIPIAFLGGLLSTRWARGGVGNLIVELEGVVETGRVRDALARALRDHTLELGYWVRDRGGYFDSYGHPVDVPDQGGLRRASVVEASGEPLAILVHDAVLLEEPDLVDAVVAAARMAMANERLRTEVRAQLEALRSASTRVVEAADAARRTVERDLHDGAQQRLVSVSLALRMLEQDLFAMDPALGPKVRVIGEELRIAIDELRELARGIHPSILTEQGLAPALDSLAERAGVPVRIATDLSHRLPGVIEATAYFVVAESLANVARHAPSAKALVSAVACDGVLVVEVTDDGPGGVEEAGGSGLRGLRDRVEATGGNLFVGKGSPGGGTVVRAELPCG